MFFSKVVKIAIDLAWEIFIPILKHNLFIEQQKIKLYDTLVT